MPSEDPAFIISKFCRDNGWSFEVETLCIACLKGCIAEAPVNWYYGEKSKVRPVWDTYAMLKEVLATRIIWGGCLFTLPI